MKRELYVLVFGLLVCSCNSGELTNKKAEKIISTCLEIKPEQRTAFFTLGRATFGNRENEQLLLAKYVKLQQEGYLEMELVKEFKTGWRKGYKEYEIKLADRSVEYMEEVREGSQQAKAKAFKYEVDKVLEVHEKPSLNTAMVKVQFKAMEITPFSIFYGKDPNEFRIEDIIMKKTSNGWKYCDDFN